MSQHSIPNAQTCCRGVDTDTRAGLPVANRRKTVRKPRHAPSWIRKKPRSRDGMVAHRHCLGRNDRTGNARRTPPEATKPIAAAQSAG